MTKALVTRMGWKPGMAARFAGLPDPVQDLFAEVSVGAAASWCAGYCTCAADLAARLTDLVPHYPLGGHLWLIYPKKSGRVASTITRDQGWEALTSLGFLPVTQVAVDADHSALRFRLRAEIPVLTRKT